MATIDQYLSTLCQYLYVSDTEYRLRLERFGNLVDRIREQFPQIREIRMFGSLTRRTGLSMRVHPNTDIDVLLAIGHREFLGKTKSMLQELHTSFEQDPAFTNVRISSPCVSLRFEGTNYDLFPVSKVEDGGYIFVGPFGAWHEGHGKTGHDERFDYGLVGVASADPDKPREMVGGTDPFFFDQHIESFFDQVYRGFFQDHLYGGLYRGLVLLLKYWKLSTPVTSPTWALEAPWSFILEENALYGLNDSTRFNGCRSLFDFLHRFLSSTDLYDYALLSRVPGFVLFKSRVEALHAAGYEPDSELALRELELIFPVPNAPVGLDPAHCFEAERMRAMLSTFVKQHAEAIGILQAAINRFEDVADDSALPMLCEALLGLGQTEECVGQPAAALATYRRLVQRYRVSTDPQVVKHVLRALTAEAKIHSQNQNWQLAMAAFDEMLTGYGHLSDPLGSFFIANTLFNRAGVLLELDRQLEAHAILLEIDRMYSKVADPDITAIVARALFQRGRLARRAGDVREEVECYSNIVSRFSTHDSLEVQEEVTAALFAKGAVLMRLRDNGTARSTFCEVVEQGATVETERADELVTAAEIWAVFLDCELGGRFGPDELATLVSQYAGDERQRVRAAVTAGQQMLADDRAR